MAVNSYPRRHRLILIASNGAVLTATPQRTTRCRPVAVPLGSSPMSLFVAVIVVDSDVVSVAVIFVGDIIVYLLALTLTLELSLLLAVVLVRLFSILLLFAEMKALMTYDEGTGKCFRVKRGPRPGGGRGGSQEGRISRTAFIGASMLIGLNDRLQCTANSLLLWVGNEVSLVGHLAGFRYTVIARSLEVCFGFVFDSSAELQ